ncbi:uncharacterized protein LOC110710934 [Chenopodium quinoa]|uniref:uncharacterized protein LOC110710934 n=1 Tax=Chenopodium quinoa TaxID=63459 RepID=UPI000B78A1CD|nr:uncharacterized protein LOC110710934 [Chenopodium quinoa]
MARCIDAFRSQLVRMRNAATCRRDDVIREGQPIASHTRTRPEVRRDPARSSSRRRRTTSGGRGGRSEAARADVAEGSRSFSEGALAALVGEATSAFRGGRMYEVGSSSQQPPQPQPQVDPGWSGMARHESILPLLHASNDKKANGELDFLMAEFAGLMNVGNAILVKVSDFC